MTEDEFDLNPGPRTDESLATVLCSRNGAHRPSDDTSRRNSRARARTRCCGVADMTYVSTWSGWVYVAFVIDAYARRIIGWRTGTSMTTALVLDAIEHAIWTRDHAGWDVKDVVHHTDRARNTHLLRSPNGSPKQGSNPA